MHSIIYLLVPDSFHESDLPFVAQQRQAFQRVCASELEFAPLMKSRLDLDCMTQTHFMTDGSNMAPGGAMI